MTTTRGLYLGMAAAGIAVLLAASAVRLSGLALSEAEGQQKPSAAVSIDKDDIGGVVTSKKGPEAGVWVIADARSTDSVRQDRRHRRSRALRSARSSQRQL